MNIRSLLLALAGFSASYPAASQIAPVQFKLRESLMESVASQNGETGDYESILNELESLQNQPVDLNSAQEEDLRKLHFLTDFQVQSLLDYRKENGNLLSLNELPLVYGFTDELISLILPYVTLRTEADTSNFRFREAVRYSHHEVILRSQRLLQESAGYTAVDPATGMQRYPGNPWQYYVRYRLEFNNNLQAGITMEKDPGEDFFKESNRGGFDFYTAHICLTDRGFLKCALIGDFRLGFGQGLTLSNGRAPGKSSLPLNVVKRNDDIKAFTSADENDFFRGAAASTAWGRLTLTGFYSVKKRDANITDTLPTGSICFSSFQGNGYHRTAAEILDEKSVTETAWGGNISFRGNHFKAGTTFVNYHLDKIREAGNDPENVHDFSGSDLFNLGSDYSVSLKKLQLFGETSYGNHHWATLNGAVLYVNKYVSFSMVYRNYSKAFFSLHSDAFSEGSVNSNEEAVYTGLVIHPVRKLKISAYADFYRFPWLRYGLSAPSSGSDYLLQVDYAVSKKVDMYCRIKFERDPEDEAGDTMIIKDIIHLRRMGLRYHVSYRLTSRLLLQSRVEMTRVNPEESKISRGFLIYQDAEYRFEAVPFVVDFRFAWFNTGDYSSRIYAYEQDLTSGFSFSPLYEQGFRTYLMLRYDVTPQLSFHVRLASTRFTHENTMGSGYDEISGNTKSEIKFQVIARL